MGCKIAFIGTHGTGKTTLVKEVIREYKEFSTMVDPYSDAGKLYKDKLLEVLDKNNLQLYFYAKHLFRVSVNDYLVTDRSVLDALCYASYDFRLGNITPTMFNFLEKVSLDLLKKYDHLFWVRPEFELKGEGKRSEDLTYQRDIDSIFEEYIYRYEIENITTVSGDLESRMKVVRHTLGLLLTE